MSLEAQISLSALVHETESLDSGDSLRVTNISHEVSMADGTGANQAQVAWSKAGTLSTATAAVVSYSLLALNDERGTINLSAVKSVVVKNTGDGRLAVTATGWSGGPFGNGQALLMAGGAAVFSATDATGYATIPALGGGPSTLGLYAAVATTSYSIVLVGEGTIS